MTALKITLLLLSTCASCLAQAGFRYYVFDQTRNDKLHYEFGQDLTIYNYDPEKPRLVYRTEYRIYGINQDEFTYTTERYEGDLSPADYAAILAQARKLPLQGLAPKRPKNEDSGLPGWIDLEGKNHIVRATPDTKIRQQWQGFIDELLAKYAPEKKRERTRRTLEGETVKPQEIDFATLLKNPKRYDGKRIKMTGFYHVEFEGCSFAATKADIDNGDRALWPVGSSSFADPKRISGLNDATLTIEGTFELGPGGHMGLWMGELVRFTESKPATAGQK